MISQFRAMRRAVQVIECESISIPFAPGSSMDAPTWGSTL
jgi:hypothetical protein